MSASLDVEVRVRRDGVDLVGSPWIRRIVQVEALDFDSTIPASQVALGGIPGAALASHNVVLLNPQAQLTLHINGGADVIMNPGAIILLLDCQLTAAETVSNGTGAAVEIQGIQAGN